MNSGRDRDDEGLGVDVIPSESNLPSTDFSCPLDRIKISRIDILEKGQYNIETWEIYIRVTMRISPGTPLICWNSSLIVVNRIIGSPTGAGVGDGNGVDAHDSVLDVDVDADEDADIDADNANDTMIDVRTVSRSGESGSNSCVTKNHDITRKRWICLFGCSAAVPGRCICRIVPPKNSTLNTSHNDIVEFTCRCRRAS
jgi:hypothetical protein